MSGFEWDVCDPIEDPLSSFTSSNPYSSFRHGGHDHYGSSCSFVGVMTGVSGEWRGLRVMLHTSSRDSLHLCHGRREVVKELVVYKLITVLIPSVVSELFTFLHVDFFVSIIVLVSFDSSIYMKSLSLYILLYRKYFVLVCQSLLLVNTFSPYI